MPYPISPVPEVCEKQPQGHFEPGLLPCHRPVQDELRYSSPQTALHAAVEYPVMSRRPPSVQLLEYVFLYALPLYVKPEAKTEGELEETGNGTPQFERRMRKRRGRGARCAFGRENPVELVAAMCSWLWGMLG